MNSVASRPASLLRQRYELRLSNLAVPRYEGHPMDDAGGGDDLVGGIASEIEVVDASANLEGERPGVNLRQGANHRWIGQIHLHLTELDQLRDLPQDDSRDAPSVRGEAP